jgi:hypothetical protein
MTKMIMSEGQDDDGDEYSGALKAVAVDDADRGGGGDGATVVVMVLQKDAVEISGEDFDCVR